MQKTKQTPGSALNALLKKNGLNYNRLAKAIGLSSAMVRLIARDENPVSAPVAFRLAKFFKTKPEYWLVLQMDFDNAKAAQDKKLAKALKDVTTIDKVTFERKPRTTKATSAKKGKSAGGKKTAAKSKAAKGTTSKKAAKSAVAKKTAKSAAPKKAAAKSAKKPAGKPKSAQAPKKAAVKAPAKKAPAVKTQPAPKPSIPVKKAPPVITVKPEPKPAEVQPVAVPQQPSVPPETPINEPQL